MVYLVEKQNSLQLIGTRYLKSHQLTLHTELHHAKTNHALSLSLNRSFHYETVNIEATAYYNFTSEEWLVRPKLKWNINDNLETSIGGFYSKGPDKSLFYYAYHFYY